MGGAVGRRAVLGMALAAGATGVAAQPAWPSRPLRCLVGAAPGGATDILARLLVPGLTARLGRPVVVENRSGGGGTVAAEALVRATDGHTMMLLNNGHAASAAVFRRLPYDPVADLAPATMVATMPLVLLGSPGGAHGTLGAMVAAARAAPGTLKLGMVGVGTTQHLVSESFATATGARFMLVPYRATPDALVALRNGEVQLVVETAGAVLGQVRDGEVRALAVTTAARFAGLPDVPTVDAAAGVAGFDIPSWFALALPATAPAAVVERLGDAARDALGDAGLRRRLRELGMDPVGSLAADARERIGREVGRSREIARAAGIARQ